MHTYQIANSSIQQHDEHIAFLFTKGCDMEDFLPASAKKAVRGGRSFDTKLKRAMSAPLRSRVWLDCKLHT